MNSTHLDVDILQLIQLSLDKALEGERDFVLDRITRLILERNHFIGTVERAEEEFDSQISQIGKELA